MEYRRLVLGDDHPETAKVINDLIACYVALHEAEPDAGHDAKAAEYQAMLEQ